MRLDDFSRTFESNYFTACPHAPNWHNLAGTVSVCRYIKYLFIQGGGQLIMPIFILVPLFADSNKTISDVLTEFQDGGCLAQYDQNGVSVSASVCVTYYSIIG